ncbi:NAD(P)/FAD-dependent oxidoreductase [Rosenbergiella collisarenosi]|uniref:NAD(P)/FAD-dependent oxidoreductase n=1 Tax=Rosenbergiella collisarenosi TaxID=1544695 RepID=UPI001F4F7E94|nr:FAD-binding oxidoreductase [Rosenbergiella collisarenosi]
MKLESFWQQTAPRFTGECQQPLPQTADVVVIGGGFSGISAARNLAKQGIDVVVLESDVVMSQASARNGGHCNSGVAQNFANLVASKGLEKATEFYRAYDDAVSYVQSVITEEGIDCDFRLCGKIKLASKPAHFTSLQSAAALMRKTVDPDVVLISATDIRDEVGSDAFYGGLLQKRGGQMHMGKFGIGLAESAVRAGAKIYQHHAVTGLTRLSGYQHRVQTANGDIIADKVLLASGCSNNGPFPWFQRRIVPVGSFIITTAPIPSEQLSQILPNDRTYVTSMNIGNYFRTTADNRLVFGGRARFSMSNPTQDARSGEILRTSLKTLFPLLASTPIDYCWGGLVDMSADRLPHAGEEEGLFFTMGYSGHGTQMSVWMGKVMADIIGEKAHHNPWQTESWPAVPGYFGKPWFLPLTGLFYKTKDRLF